MKPLDKAGAWAGLTGEGGERIQRVRARETERDRSEEGIHVKADGAMKRLPSGG